MELKLLPCPLCQRPHFDGVDALRTSLISVATNHLKCPVCQHSFLGLDKLTIHLFSHVAELKQAVEQARTELGQVAESLRCDICMFSFNDRSMLEMHQKLLHQTTTDAKTGTYSYHCHMCSKRFKKRGSLMVHLRVAHRRMEHLAPTATMPAGSSTIMANTTTANKRWICEVCSKTFTTKYFLKKHNRLHTGEMPYECSICGKSFTFQQSYHKHMLYHSTEKPYACEECGRAFKELSTLQNHARIHSGERPFACETCGKRFRQRVSYLVHSRIHTGAMPYECTACHKRFRYKVSQRSHKCPVDPPGTVIRIAEETNTCPINVDLGRNDQSRNPTENGGKSEVDMLDLAMSPILPDVQSLTLDATKDMDKTHDLLSQQAIEELLFGVVTNHKP